MHGTSVITICDVAGIRHEIMVRNVVFGGIAARPEGSPHHDSAEVVAVMEAGRHAVTLFS